jgi:hypothetical protein
VNDRRFWERVDAGSGECWLWLGARSRKGYGEVRRHGLTLKAHRWAWESTYGPIPDGMCVLHSCDVRECVNPGHLFLGTVADNNADRHAKGRDARGPKRGIIARGELNGRSRLTAADVVDIRAAFGKSQATLARAFGVSKGTVAAVLQNRTWRVIA